MSAHVLLNLLNKFLSHNKFDKFNNTGAQMLDSINHMILKLLLNRIFGVKTARFTSLLRTVIMGVIM